jgi:hypothetical protein
MRGGTKFALQLAPALALMLGVATTSSRAPHPQKGLKRTVLAPSGVRLSGSARGRAIRLRDALRDAREAKSAGDLPAALDGIFGKVSINGQPAAGIVLNLVIEEPSGQRRVAATATDPDGNYLFAGPPKPTPGERYRVVFLRDDQAQPSSLLYFWETPPIEVPESGELVPGGDFDVADLVHDQPRLAIPHTAGPVRFRWHGREGVPMERYSLIIEQGLEPEAALVFDALGRASGRGYTLTSIPPGLAGGNLSWYVYIESAAGRGVSAELTAIQFEPQTGPPPASASFADDFSQPASGWAHDRLRRYVDDEYALTPRGRDSMVSSWAPVPPVAGAVVLEATARQVGPGQDGQFGLAFAGQGDRFIAFMLDPGHGLFDLWQAVGDDLIWLTGDDRQVVQQVSSRLVRLRATGFDGYTSLFVDDTFLLSADLRLLATRTGLVAYYGGAQSYQIRFDDFRLEVLGPRFGLYLPFSRPSALGTDPES